MLVYVMRHGPAEDRAPSGRDFDRALTPDGREVVARSARALHEARRALGPRSWRVLASPFRRARETAEIVASLAPVTVPALEVELHDDLAADEGPAIRLVGELAAEGTDALLVGHQPSVEQLVGALLHPAHPSLPGGFRTALVVAIERVSPSLWRRSAVIDPHQAQG